MQPTVHISGFLSTQISNLVLSERGDTEGLLYGKTEVYRSSLLNDSNDCENTVIHIHLTGFKAAAPSMALHDSQGIIDWSSVLSCHGNKVKGSLDSIVGLFKCRAGVPLKPTLRDRFTTRSFTSSIMSCVPTRRFGLGGGQDETHITNTLGFPIVMGLFTASLDANNLLVQDCGFYHVPASAPSSPSPPSSISLLGSPLRSCRVKIINLAPLVQQSMELLQDEQAQDPEQDLVLHQQRHTWIALHNLLYKQINSARNLSLASPQTTQSLDKRVDELNL